MNMSPKKSTISKGIFMGYFVSFFGEWLHQNGFKPSWACPPKELPFLRRQPWWRRGKGFRHGGRSKRQGHDRWLLQWRDGKHLRRNAAGRTLGSIVTSSPTPKKREEQKLSLVILFAFFFLGVEIYGNTQVFCKGASMGETSFWWRLMAAKMVLSNQWGYENLAAWNSGERNV